MGEWYEESENELGSTSGVEQNYYEVVCAKEIDGIWTYAIVRWHYGSPSLRVLMRDGGIIENNTND